jgi:hypothetical protein
MAWEALAPMVLSFNNSTRTNNLAILHTYIGEWPNIFSQISGAVKDV